MLIENDMSPLLTLGIKGLFFILLIAFAFHALVLAYHWFAYGNHKSTSMLALGIYLSGGAVLLVTFAISLTTF
jgi:hypothetical protein